MSVDFGENMRTDNSRNKTQSSYFKTASVTVFMGVPQYLDLVRWNDLFSVLEPGTEVSVELEDRPDEFVYGIVAESTGASSDTSAVMVTLPYLDSITVSVPRLHVHPRKLITEALVIVSDDKKHDSYAVQHFLEEVFVNRWLQGKPIDFRRRILEVIFDSDGAPSHFKQKYTLQSLYGIKTNAPFTRLRWLFGAPGHGKGVWDGLIGVVKNKAIAHMIRERLVYANSSEGAYGIFLLIKDLFDKEIAPHEEATNLTVRKWNVEWVSTEDIQKRRPAEGAVREEVDTITAFVSRIGVRKLFCFEADGDLETGTTSLIVQRFGHFCSLCMKGPAGACTADPVDHVDL